MVERRFVREELEKARQALADAEQLSSGSGSDEGVVNRLYYAGFHAAQAALYSRDVNPSSHGAVRNRFGEVFVVPGEFSRDKGRLLTTLADLRQQADYGYEPLSVDVDDLFARTSAFVADVVTLVEGE